ncbi:methyltransferase-like protein 25 [Aplysia californica]|uniref:Methyltransferase-like protein 25 n=1 Tax=Aplysia californica TaxID=6500 RepID=A0ABM0K6M7_APLCA|nr:methyltransferase-like protein 25 [Aplysia californica]
MEEPYVACAGSDASSTLKQKRLEQLIGDIWAFLEEYLTLLNTHGAEFISAGHWEKLVPVSVRPVLLSLSDEELCDLPLGKAEFKNCTTSNEEFKTGVQWLKSFIQAALQFHMENTNTLQSIDTVLGEGKVLSEGREVVSEAMCQKKVHEVGLMSEVVVAMCSACSADLVIDIGSGKGYLSCELARQHHMPVLGLDSREGNTHSAASRDSRLSKRWAGLTRRQQRQQEMKKKSSQNSSSGTQKTLCEKERPSNCDSSVSKLVHNSRGNTDDVKPKSTTLERGQSPSSGGSSGVCDHPLTQDIEEQIKMCTLNQKEKNVSESTVDSSDNDIKRHGNRNNKVDAETTCFSPVLDSDGLGDGEAPSSVPEVVQQNGSGPSSSNKGLYVPVTMYVQPDMNVRNILASTAAHLCRDRPVSDARLLVAGLHTCGSLAVTSLQLFIQDPGAVGLCSVGCCYHLMEEGFSQDTCGDVDSHFPLSQYAKRKQIHLGRNARNVASQAVHRIHASRQLQGGDFFWRALLEVLIHDLELSVPERIVGMRGLVKRSKCFYEYAVAAFKKLGLPSEKLLQGDVEALEHCCAGDQLKMTTFFQLKLALAPVVETLILADRYLYLLEQDCVADAHLVQLFDPVTSPRCCALIARKKSL